MPELEDRKHELFCQEFMRDLCATKAAVRAGYSKHTADDLKSDPEIVERIDELWQEKKEKLKMDVDEVLIRLAVIGRGEHPYAKVADIIKSLELIGKYHAMFTEKKEVDFGKETMERLTDMSLEARKSRLDQLIGSFHDGSE